MGTTDLCHTLRPSMMMWKHARFSLLVSIIAWLTLSNCARGPIAAPQMPNLEPTTTLKAIASRPAPTALPTIAKTPGVLSATPSSISPTSIATVQASATPIFAALEFITTENVTRLDLLSELVPRRSSETIDLEFNPAGDIVAGASADGDLLLWHLAREVQGLALGEVRRQIIGLSGQISALAFHPDGRQIALGRSDKGVDIWDIDTGQETWHIPGRTTVGDVLFLEDGSILAVAGELFDFDTETWERTIEIWDVSAKELSLVLDEHPHGDFFCSLTATDEQTVLAAGYCNYNMMTWDVQNNFEPLGRVLGLYAWRCPSHCPPAVNRVRFRPGTTLLVSGTDNPDLPMRDITSGRLTLVYTTARTKEFESEAGPRDSTYAPQVSDLAFSPDGSLLVLTAWNDIQVREANTGELLYLYEIAPGEQPARLDFSRDGRLIAVGTSLGHVYLFGVEADSGE